MRSDIRCERERERERERVICDLCCCLFFDELICVVVWFWNKLICIIIWFWVRLICDKGVQNVGNLTKNPNLWETKQVEKTHAKENNHTHKTIFMWFGNLPTFTELQGFHYYQRKYNSAQEHSQEIQIPIHPNSLSPTR